MWPFVVFIKMTKHHDAPEWRHKLHDTYRLFGIYIGIPLLVFAYAWNLANFCNYVLLNCFEAGVYCECTEQNIFLIIFEALGVGALWGAFRFYFLSVMKKYHEEGMATHVNQPAMVAQPAFTTQPGYAQPGYVAVAQPGYTAQPGYATQPAAQINASPYAPNN